MRTTVDIDAYLLDRLRDEAHAEGISLRAKLNRTIRQGLEATTPKAEAYVCPTFAMGAPVRDLDKALSVAEALEREEVGRKLSKRK